MVIRTKYTLLPALMAASAVLIAGCGRKTDTSPGKLTGTENEPSFRFTQTDDSPSFAPYSQTYAVQHLNWGDSVEDVKDCETARYTGGTEAFLLYEDDLCGQRARIMHTFENGKLYGVIYDISDTDMDARTWIDYQAQVKDYLSTRYGPPYEDSQMIFEGEDKAEISPEDLADARAGLTTIWDTERCYIWMQTLADEDGSICMSIVFTDPDFSNEPVPEP